MPIERPSSAVNAIGFGHAHRQLARKAGEKQCSACRDGTGYFQGLNGLGLIKISRALFESLATRLLAADVKATVRPSPLTTA